MAKPIQQPLTFPSFRLPLIGGSLYSTVQESARFARMILQRGRFGTKASWTEKLSILSFPFLSKAKLTGWVGILEENGRLTEISHSDPSHRVAYADQPRQ